MIILETVREDQPTDQEANEESNEQDEKHVETVRLIIVHLRFLVSRE
jgi:hypothetical protein